MAILNRSGQTLMIAVLIGTILLISIPIVVFLNQIGSWHQVASQKRTKARSIAEEGISYATQQLSVNFQTWQAAQGNSFNGTLPGAVVTDCNTGLFVPSPSGGQFKLLCSIDAVANKDLQPYQVAVTAVAYMKDGNDVTAPPIPIRAMQAYLSQRTLGTDLANGVHAAAVLQLVKKPNFPTPAAGILVAHWGPVVCLDTSLWTLQDPMDRAGSPLDRGYPRKFSQGGITGAAGGAFLRSPDTGTSAATSDQREYWAFASQSFPPSIDEIYYKNASKNETTFNNAAFWPTVGAAGPQLAPSSCGTGNCGYFDAIAAGGTAFFDGGAPGYAVPAAGSIVWVNGNAQFDRIDIDNATFIITGNLTLGNAAGGSLRNLHVPYTAPSEYSYWQGPAWPCSANAGQAGYPCASTTGNLAPGGGNVHFRGFLYVKGNLTVNAPNWNLVGSVLVGDTPPTGPTGQLTVNAGNNLTLVYDDLINHDIHVNPVSVNSLKVAPDLLRDVPIP